MQFIENMPPTKYSDKILMLLFFLISLCIAKAQQVENVPNAFESLSLEPTVYVVNNNLEVPTKGGHLQGIQVVNSLHGEKLLLSGSSLKQAYLIQIDLTKRKSDRLIGLMNDPYRHAGGFQVSGSYLGIGIEDNHAKTSSKVCFYTIQNGFSQASIVIERNGIAKEQTAGSVGLIPWNDAYFAVVSNWDSRNWDFYSLNFQNNESKFLKRFDAPQNWGSYQSINFVSDKESIYAIGFYLKDKKAIADLFLLSGLTSFEPDIELISSKIFNCSSKVDFSGAVGLQVDDAGKLHIWASQKDAFEQIEINRFSEK